MLVQVLLCQDSPKVPVLLDNPGYGIANFRGSARAPGDVSNRELYYHDDLKRLHIVLDSGKLPS